MSEHNFSDGSLVVVIDATLPPAAEERIRRLSPEIEVIHGLSATALGKAHVIYTFSGRFDPTEAPNLRWVQTNGAGVEGVLDGPLGNTDIPIANVRGAYTPAVAEVAIGLMLALGRRFPAAQSMQSGRQWPKSKDDYELIKGENSYGKTMGIVGYGSIGRHVARIAQAMGMTILACKRRPEIRRGAGFQFPDTGDPDGTIPQAWYGPEQLPEMLRSTDVAVVALPHTPATRGMIGQRELDALPAHAHLINISRGAVIDEAALIEHLGAGKLAAAGLDVFVDEPLPGDSPFWTLPNVIVTTHIGSWTREQASVASEVLIENLSRELSGRPLVNVVDREAGY